MIDEAKIYYIVVQDRRHVNINGAPVSLSFQTPGQRLPYQPCERHAFQQIGVIHLYLIVPEGA